jgi:hypothetical protein
MGGPAGCHRAAFAAFQHDQRKAFPQATQDGLGRSLADQSFAFLDIREENIDPCAQIEEPRILSDQLIVPTRVERDRHAPVSRHGNHVRTILQGCKFRDVQMNDIKS